MESTRSLSGRVASPWHRVDGDLTDAGEGLGRWASNGTLGSEFTGLYFDPTDKRRAWVNIQHPASGNDRVIEITTR